MVATGTKFTEARRRAILDALRKGHTLTTAAAFAGITRQTLYNWLQRGEKAPEGNYGKFAMEVAQASAEAADVAINSVTGAFPDDWRAAMEFLSRRFPDEWGKRERHEVSGPTGEPIRIEVKWPNAATAGEEE